MNKNITAKDIESFGQFLEALGKVLKSKPDVIRGLIKEAYDSIGNNSQEPEEAVDINKINVFNLFEVAKALEEQSLIARLLEFTLEELKFILKTYHLGGSKIRSKDGIAKHIAEQAKKRTVDVFRDHTGESMANIEPNESAKNE